MGGTPVSRRFFFAFNFMADFGLKRMERSQVFGFLQTQVSLMRCAAGSNPKGETRHPSQMTTQYFTNF
jgi:hypothetical protein